MWLYILAIIVAIGMIFFQLGPSQSSSSSSTPQMGGRKHKLSYKHHRRHRK